MRCLTGFRLYSIAPVLLLYDSKATVISRKRGCHMRKVTCLSPVCMHCFECASEWQQLGTAIGGFLVRSIEENRSILRFQTFKWSLCHFLYPSNHIFVLFYAPFWLETTIFCHNSKQKEYNLLNLLIHSCFWCFLLISLLRLSDFLLISSKIQANDDKTHESRPFR